MPDPVTRREFAGMVLAGAVVSHGDQPLNAADKPKAEDKPASPVDLLVDLVREKYPHERLTGDALDEVRADFGHFVGRSKTLSSFPLTNADEPGFVFAAWRADRPVH